MVERRVVYIITGVKFFIQAKQCPMHTNGSLDGTWEVASLDSEALCALLDSNDGVVPSRALGSISSRIEALSGNKAPKTLAQRRVFIGDWRTSERGRSGESLPPQPIPRQNSRHGPPPAIRPPSASPATLSRSGEPAAATAAAPATAAPVTPGGVDGGELSRSLSASRIRRIGGASAEERGLAAEIGQLKVGGQIPTQAVPLLCERVAAALGQERSPASLSARRCLIDDWYAAVLPHLEQPRIEQQQQPQQPQQQQQQQQPRRWKKPGGF